MCEQAKVFHQDSYYLQIVKGNSHSINNKNLKAINCFRKAIKLKENQIYGYFLLGHEYLFLKDFQQSIYFLEKGKRRNPYNFLINYCLGLVELKKEQFYRATIYLDIAKLICPESGVVYSTLGMCYLNISLYKDALKNFIKVFLVTPKDANNILDLAYTYYLLKDYKSSLRYLKSVSIGEVSNKDMYTLVKSKINFIYLFCTYFFYILNIT